ncbi:GDP-fucose protein O-fucosyltransferase 1 [Aphelenchoides bicaudatus]|nr:GDP-fucose protein O-fucosyltransferase 1 [Aphelenchoides bicaudatus]
MQICKLFLSLIFLVQIWKADAQDEGFLLFCPCMGRFGNQFEQYLGTLNFAKHINRTLVLAPFLEYPFGETKAKVVPFTNVFEVEPLRAYHKVITMEEFITTKAKKIWPESEREVFCWEPRQSLKGNSVNCQAKEGNPFGPFWDYYGVDFVSDNYYGEIGTDVSDPSVVDGWKKRYPNDKYPVIAFSSAPASFPVEPENRHLQAYFKWSKDIREEAEYFVSTHITRPFVGIHLRNNVDWVNACNHVESDFPFFASSQCTGDKFEYGRPSKEMCLPSDAQILRDVKYEVNRVRAKTLFISTDKNPMLREFNELFNNTVGIRRLNKDNLYLSLAILDLADHLIANCMSTYSAFSVRQRRVLSENSYTSVSFFGFNPTQSVSQEKIVRLSSPEQILKRDEL